MNCVRHISFPIKLIFFMDIYKILDDLAQGVRIVLAKNRSSLSVDDVARLEIVLFSIDELKKTECSSDRKTKFSGLLLDMLKTFTRFKLAKELNDLFEDIFS